jgi:hypothetical protein
MAKKSQIKVKAKKPSTYAAISGLAGALAMMFPQYAHIAAGVGALAGVVGTFLPDPLDLAASRREVEAP